MKIKLKKDIKNSYIILLNFKICSKIKIHNFFQIIFKPLNN